MISELWQSLRLSQRFLVAAAAVLLGGMATIGWWVSERISRAVTNNSAQAAALYMESSVTPLIESLAERSSLSEESLQRLDQLLDQPAIKAQAISMKVWRLDGTIVYSRWREMIGKQYAPTPSLSRAAAGTVAAEFESDPHHEHELERAVGYPLLEVYAPIRARDTRAIIGVSEFYVDGRKLKADLREATLLSWLVVGTVTLAMMTALWGIVRGGSATIETQRRQLTQQIDELQVLLNQNETLRGRLQSANERVSETNERLLQRIGADLHDGPAQLLAYALLRLKKFEPRPDQKVEHSAAELEDMRLALTESLTEVRSISTGLSLPGLGGASLEQVISMAVSQHQERTNTDVELEASSLPVTCPQALKVCVFRFVQEGLANATRHAQANGQQVVARGRSGLEIQISDTGTGLLAGKTFEEGLGLTGMRARVEALGGSLSIDSHPGTGTRLTARFPQSTITSR